MPTTTLRGNITLETSPHGIGGVIEWKIKIPYSTSGTWRDCITSRLSCDNRFHTSERQMLDDANEVLVLNGYVDDGSILVPLRQVVNNP